MRTSEINPITIKLVIGIMEKNLIFFGGDMFIIGVVVQSSGVQPSFYGSLIGSFISGSVAVGILIYNNWQKNKEFNYRCYGTMKVINSRLTHLSQAKQVTLEICRRMVADNDSEGLLNILTRSKNIFEERQIFLEKERANIPYVFTSRYLTITSAINSVIVAYDELIEEFNLNKVEELNMEQLNKVEQLIKRLECTEMINEFLENTNKYLKDVEKKYKIKDFY